MPFKQGLSAVILRTKARGKRDEGAVYLPFAPTQKILRAYAKGLASLRKMKIYSGWGSNKVATFLRTSYPVKARCTKGLAAIG